MVLVLNANPRKLNENSRKYNFTSIHVSFTSIRVQINKLFNVVTVVVNISKTTCHSVFVPFDDAKVQHFSSDFKHIHSRSKTVQNQWISRRFRSFPFTLIQRFYGRTSKHPQDVRPYPLRTYVHRPFERTSTAPLVVRP